MPPKEELFRPFENIVELEVAGETLVFEWMTRNKTWFRPRGARVELLWGSPWAHDDEDSTEFSLEEQQDQTRELMGTIWRNKRFYRYIPLPSNLGVPIGSWAVLRLGESGVELPGIWRCANWNVVFPWIGEREEFLYAPIEVLRTEIERAISNAPQEWEDVIAWAQRNGEERFWSLVSWDKGSEREWTLLVRSLLQMEMKKAQTPTPFHWPIFVMAEPRFAFGSLVMEKNSSTNEFSPAVWSLLDLARHYFDAKINYSRSRSNFNWPFPLRSIVPAIRATIPPTQHELMEAIELWRDFGRKSGQLAQVEACLRQLLT